MILPIWLSDWELGCCPLHATRGEPWSASVFLHPGEPWWVKENGGTLDPAQAEVGEVELDLDVVRPAPGPDGAALATDGTIHVGLIGVVSLGRRRVKGRLMFEGHDGPEGVTLDEVECHGTVRRVRRVPIVYELRGPWVPVGQLAPIEVDSTAVGTQPRPSESDSFRYDDTWLVDLEV